jgi:predicted DNA binding protein
VTAIAELAFPTEAYPLGEAVSVPEGTHVELERIVPTGEEVLPYLWVESTTPTAFVDHLRAQPAVRTAEVIYEDDGEMLLRAAWRLGPGSLLRFVADVDVALVSARGTADGWEVELRGPRSVLRRVETFCRERGIESRLVRVYEATPSGSAPDRYDLTPLQYETLVTSLEAGYFDEPRAVTLEELAGDLDVSARAVSRRIRRGTANVLRAELLGEE